MISTEKQYEFVTSQIAERLKQTRDAFRLFVQVFTAIVGGSVALVATEKIKPEAKPHYAIMSNLLVVFLTLAMTIMIIDSLRGWYANRKTQVQLGGFDLKGHPIIPPPRIPPSGISEIAMILAMIAACAGFCAYNPFIRF